MLNDLKNKINNDFPGLISKRLDSIWCPIGWHDLIYNLSKEINNIRESIITKLDSDYQVVQIKIKFSGLRYYMSSSTAEMNELISMVENKSYDICGSCGNNKGPGKPNENLWENNICDTCNMIKNIIE